MKRWQKIIIGLLVCVGLLVLGVVFWRFYQSGTLIVDGSEKTRTIKIIDSTGKTVTERKARQLKTRLYKGEYTVFISSDTAQATGKSTRVLPRKTTKVRLGLNPLLSKPIITDVSASLISIVKDSAVLLQPVIGALKVPSMNSRTPLPIHPSLYYVQFFQLDKSGSGVAMTNNGLFYGLQDGKVNDLGEAIFSENQKFGNPQNIRFDGETNTIVISGGNKVYRSVNLQSAVKPAFESSAPISDLEYSSSGWVALNFSSDDESEQDFEKPQEEEPSGLTLVNLNTKEQITVGKGSVVGKFAWLPKTKKILYATKSRIILFDTETKKEEFIASLNPSSYSIIPCTNSNFLIKDTKSLWEFSLSSNDKTFRKIIDGTNINTAVCDDKMLYLSELKPPSSGNVYRVELNSLFNETIDKLNKITPYRGDGYEITYSGFSAKPKVFINVNIPRNLAPSDRTNRGLLGRQILTANKSNKAQEYLRSQGLKFESVEIIIAEQYN